MDEDVKKFFYSRQTVLKELGEVGQKKLSNARVAVVGIGGLGGVSSLYLVLAGIGYIRVIDHDTVDPHNLHRQILYSPNNIGSPKAEVAAEQLRRHNPLVQVETASEKLGASNAEKLLKDVDVVVDALDNMQSRHAVNRACLKLHVPYVFGAAVGFEGNVSVFYPPKTGCLECSMGALTGNSQSCAKRGIVGATAGIIGSIQAMETIKLLAGFGETLLGKLLVCDFTDMNFTTIPLAKNPHCPICHR
jgi:molybdopterin/thiamine biosynthesis adenylyltransferase